MNSILETETLEGQQSDSWCWAATTRIFSKHYYSNISLTQQYAVEIIESQPAYSSGINSLEKAQATINLYISNSSNAAISTTVQNYKTYSSSAVQNFINDGHVLCISRGKYIPENSNGIYRYESGHLTLLYGYFSIDSQIYFLIRDPGVEGYDGYTYVWTYSKLYCDMLFDEGYVTAWDGAIVPTTTYSGSYDNWSLHECTILYPNQ